MRTTNSCVRYILHNRHPRSRDGISHCCFMNIRCHQKVKLKQTKKPNASTSPSELPPDRTPTSEMDAPRQVNKIQPSTIPQLNSPRRACTSPPSHFSTAVGHLPLSLLHCKRRGIHLVHAPDRVKSTCSRGSKRAVCGQTPTTNYLATYKV